MMKSLNFRDEIFSLLSRINLPINKNLKTRKFADKYLFYVFFAFIYLSITNFPYAVEWPAKGLKILDGPP